MPVLSFSQSFAFGMAVLNILLLMCNFSPLQFSWFTEIDLKDLSSFSGMQWALQSIFSFFLLLQEIFILLHGFVHLLWPLLQEQWLAGWVPCAPFLLCPPSLFSSLWPFSLHSRKLFEFILNNTNLIVCNIASASYASSDNFNYAVTVLISYQPFLTSSFFLPYGFFSLFFWNYIAETALLMMPNSCLKWFF